MFRLCTIDKAFMPNFVLFRAWAVTRSAIAQHHLWPAAPCWHPPLRSLPLRSPLTQCSPDRLLPASDFNPHPLTNITCIDLLTCPHAGLRLAFLAAARFCLPSSLSREEGSKDHQRSPRHKDWHKRLHKMTRCHCEQLRAGI